MLRVTDVATYLNVCRRVAYAIVKQPGFPLVILRNKSWRIPRDAFFAWLEEDAVIAKLTAAHAATQAHAPHPAEEGLTE